MNFYLIWAWEDIYQDNPRHHLLFDRVVGWTHLKATLQEIQGGLCRTCEMYQLQNYCLIPEIAPLASILLTCIYCGDELNYKPSDLLGFLSLNQELVKLGASYNCFPPGDGSYVDTCNQWIFLGKIYIKWYNFELFFFCNPTSKHWRVWSQKWTSKLLD